MCFPVKKSFNDKVYKFVQNPFLDDVRQLILSYSNGKLSDSNSKAVDIQILQSIELTLDSLQEEDVREVRIQGFDESMLRSVLSCINTRLRTVKELIFEDITGTFTHSHYDTFRSHLKLNN